MKTEWLRQTIRDFEPYKVPEIQEHTIINANESPYNILDFPSVREDFLKGLAELKSYRYPDPFAEDLRKALAEYVQCRPGQILATNGGDETISLILNTFINPGDTVLVHTPTFDIYGIDATVLGARVVHVPDDDGYCRSAEKLQQAIADMQPKVTFVCNPNNPTGSIWPVSVIEKLLQTADNIVVVDEAYLEFSGQDSVIPLMEQYDNLIVIRTLSKAFGLAGFRLGYGVAREDIIDALSLTKLSYNLNSVTHLMGCVAMKHSDEILGHNLPPTIENRDYLERELNGFDGVTAYPSATNFILVRVPDGPELIGAMKDADICVRFYSAKDLQNCIRLTVTTRDVADRIVAVFRSLYKEVSRRA